MEIFAESDGEFSSIVVGYSFSHCRQSIIYPHISLIYSFRLKNDHETWHTSFWSWEWACQDETKAEMWEGAVLSYFCFIYFCPQKLANMFEENFTGSPQTTFFFKIIQDSNFTASDWLEKKSKFNFQKGLKIAGDI